MYHVTVNNTKGVIAQSFSESLADAVMFGREVGVKGNRITVYDSVQDATGEVLHLSRVLTVTLEE